MRTPTVWAPQGSKCVPQQLSRDKPAMSKASLAGLWAGKSLWGSRAADGGMFWLLASKAPQYNGRGVEGVYSFTPGGNRQH